MNSTMEFTNTKPMRSKKRRLRRRRQIAYLAICGLSVAIFAIALATLIRPAAADDDPPPPEDPPAGDPPAGDPPAGDPPAGDPPAGDPPAGDAPAGAPPAGDPPAGAPPAGDPPGEKAPADAPASDPKNPPADEGDSGRPWREGYSGDGTTHEQLGQPHWTPVEYTPYRPTTNYSEEPPKLTSAMNPIFNFTHFIFDTVLYTNDSFPPGYITIKNGDTLQLGPKVQENDWRDLLAHYWLVFIWILLLMVLIIVVPFIAVCYCCFCCCKRCRQGCPPCTSKQDAQRRCCCGVCLLLLIIGLIFGIIIAFVTNKMLEDGFGETDKTMKRGGQDTCTYLKDVADHVHHLLVYNYEELETHVNDQLARAHDHIFLDLTDTSQSTSLSDLERVLDNMPEALILMKEIDKMQKDLVFFGSQLRDGVRGMKRDINFAVANLCQVQMCQKFLVSSNIEHIDTSPCLHFDWLPNTKQFIDGMQEIINMKYAAIPKKGLKQLSEVKEMVAKQMSFVVPTISRDLNKGKGVFREQATSVRNVVEAVLSDIHHKTLSSTKSFEDVYTKFGPDRSVVSLLVGLIILLILFILIWALLCGCFGRRRSGYGDECCSKSTGATCLLIAIILIFCVFSFICLVGLFYFVIGLVTYQGACAPLRDRENNAVFRQLDAAIDVNRYLPRHDDKDAPPMKMSSALKSCNDNETVFVMMRQHKIYDINDLSRVKVISSDPSAVRIFNDDLSKVKLIEKDDREKLKKLGQNQLGSYRGSTYSSRQCTKFTPMNLIALSEQLSSLSNDLEYPAYGWAKVSFWNEGLNAKTLHRNFVPKLTSLVEKMRATWKKIDEMILFNNLDFEDSITLLNKAVIDSEEFIQTRGKDYINVLGTGLTTTIQKQIDDYVKMVMREANENVGHCAPLGYIYQRGVDLICHRLVDPINGYWVGILLCAFLFLPILYVAHRLMCLYKKIYPYLATVGAGGVVEGGVPKKRRKAYERRHREQQDYYEDASPSASRATRSGGERGGGGGGGERGDGAPGSSSMRYNDMAPTHWDHEPPRYHNPPAAPPSSEYERPPPYYYPGASEQD
ncbi:prominin-like protein isoform X2 [Drosophila serrata]|uniref:prominin-like protein isoform X2 n=1 Tax=Drosophila serrata TaxID=7274 RepID=UPI000A1D2E06|nr:prominin-like protein isoform X2 [Drosophila serrata]